MAGFRGPNSYAGVAGADLENAPSGPVPFTSPIGLPVTRMQLWHAGGGQPGSNTGGIPGTPIQRVSGNPSVATQPAVGPWKNPYGGANTPSELPQFGRRAVFPWQEGPMRAPGGTPVGGANDKLIGRDRHGMMKVGYENSGRNSGYTDPPMDGPARPSLWLVQRSINYQQGTDTTAATDDLQRDYTRNAQGMYIGEQGTGWSRVYGGVPGLYQEYGSYSGISPASPPAPNDTCPGIHSPVPQGVAGDGPHTLWSGPPHGLHSPTLPTYSQTLGRYMDIPQQSRPRIDRPSQSPIAGQSYSQTVQSQGQTGFTAPSSVGRRPGGGVPAFNTRTRGNGWRGRAQG